MADDKKYRKLTITKCEVGYEGTGKNDKPYTRYNVEAVDETGAAVEQKLNSFRDLPIGELINFEVTSYTSDKNGQTYFTLHPPKGKGGSSKGVKELEGRVDTLERNFKWAREQIEALQRSGAPVAGAPPAAAQPPREPVLQPGQNQDGSYGKDDDIPF